MSQEPKEDFQFGKSPQNQPYPGSEPTDDDTGNKAAGIGTATMPDHDEPDEDTAYGATTSPPEGGPLR
jgi:hypothetical protein